MNRFFLNQHCCSQNYTNQNFMWPFLSIKFPTTGWSRNFHHASNKKFVWSSRVKIRATGEHMKFYWSVLEFSGHLVLAKRKYFAIFLQFFPTQFLWKNNTRSAVHYSTKQHKTIISITYLYSQPRQQTAGSYSTRRHVRTIRVHHWKIVP